MSLVQVDALVIETRMRIFVRCATVDLLTVKGSQPENCSFMGDLDKWPLSRECL